MVLSFPHPSLSWKKTGELQPRKQLSMMKEVYVQMVHRLFSQHGPCPGAHHSLLITRNVHPGSFLSLRLLPLHQGGGIRGSCLPSGSFADSKSSFTDIPGSWRRGWLCLVHYSSPGASAASSTRTDCLPMSMPHLPLLPSGPLQQTSNANSSYPGCQHSCLRE